MNEATKHEEESDSGTLNMTTGTRHTGWDNKTHKTKPSNASNKSKVPSSTITYCTVPILKTKP